MSSFSVCIPHYGSEHLLLEAVKSVAAQSVNNFDLVISLDSPVSEQQLRQIRSLMPNTHFTQGSRTGIADNWNHCIKQAKGTYIVLLHSDDKLKPNYLARMERLTQLYESADAWFCGVELINERGQATKSLADSIKAWIEPSQHEYRLHGDRGLAQILKGCFIYCPTICYRSETIRQFGFSHRWDMVLDLELYARLLMAGKSIVGTKEVLFEYRRHSQNTTAKLTKTLTRFEEEWSLYRLITEQSKTKGWHKSTRVAKHKVILRLHVLFCALKALTTLELKLCWSYIRQALAN